MCGRYTIAKPKRIVEVFKPDLMLADSDRPRFNIAPMQKVPVVMTEEGRSVVRDCQWGLVPAWAKDPAIGSRMINARAESVATKPSFRDSFRRYRCLVPFDGFYEWRLTPEGRKQPTYIRVDEGAMLAFAGLYARWTRGGSSLLTCTIITTEANEKIKPIHERMPVILPPYAWPQWTDASMEDSAELESMLKAFDGGRMDACEVSSVVNSPSNDSPDCIAPLDHKS